MKDMTLKARLYIILVVLAGGVMSFALLPQTKFTDDWIPGVILSILASLTFLIKVIGATTRSSYSLSFLVYAFSLFYLGVPWAIVIMIISNVVDWYQHKVKWYIQLFNMGAYVITFVATMAVFNAISPMGVGFTITAGLGIILSVGTYVFVNHLAVGLVIWFARGQNFAESGVFEFLTVMIDFTMLGLGAVSALLWDTTPVLTFILVAPLYLIQHTLRVPALERGVVQDPKTKLFNAEYVMSAIDKEIGRANRFDRPMTVVIGDMDLLRNVNNNYGHVAGDVVLLTVANILNESVRDSDVVARYGGEEFVILMPETSADAAYNRVEEIREKIAHTPIEVTSSVEPIFVTMSFGVAQRDGFGQTKEDIIHNADLALYHSKLKGRNRTFVYLKENFEEFYRTEDEKGKPDDLQGQGNEAKVGSQMYKSMLEYAELKTSARENEEPPTIEEVNAESASDTNEKAGKKTLKRSGTATNFFILGFFLVSVILLSILGVDYKQVEWLGLSVFALIVFFTEFMAIEIYVRETSVSTSAAPLLAGILIFGPMGAIVVGVAMSIAAWLKNRGPLNRLIFNFSNQAFAAGVILLLIKFSNIDYQNWSQAGQIFVCLVSSMILYFLTTGLISLAMWLDSGRNIVTVWKAQFRWLMVYYLVFGALAYALIFGYLNFDVIGLLFIVTPLFLLRISQKQYIDHTKRSVEILTIKNIELQHQSDEISQLNEELLNVFASLLDLRDPFVLGHSQQVAKYSVAVGREMGLPDVRIENLRKSAILHDIGKLAISDALLSKPGRLTSEEYQEMRNHVVLGSQLITQSTSIKHLKTIVANHHEFFNGEGYPNGLSGKRIPIEARILGLADAVEAMSSDRPYRKALSHSEIISEVIRCRGTQFDPEVVDTFLTLVERKGKGFFVNSAEHIHKEAESFSDRH